MSPTIRTQLKRFIPNKLLEARKQAVLQRQRRQWGPVPSQGEQGDRAVFFHHAFKALAFNGISGDYAEFGCHGGMTFELAYRESRRQHQHVKLWAFDSFAGLPPTADAADEHPFWRPGTLATPLEQFHQTCADHGIPRTAYATVAGFYADTLPALDPQSAPTDIALAYIDCDLYSSTREVLAFLLPRLKHGMIIAFDDYFCWSATQPAGERRAMREVFDDHPQWSLLPYVTFGWHGQAFVVEDKTLFAQPVNVAETVAIGSE